MCFPFTKGFSSLLTLDSKEERRQKCTESSRGCLLWDCWFSRLSHMGVPERIIRETGRRPIPGITMETSTVHIRLITVPTTIDVRRWKHSSSSSPPHMIPGAVRRQPHHRPFVRSGASRRCGGDGNGCCRCLTGDSCRESSGSRTLIQCTERCNLNLFQLGFRLLDHLLIEERPIPAAFAP